MSRKHLSLTFGTPKKYKEIRGNLANANRNHSPCNRCDANGMQMGGEFVSKWKEYYEGQKPVKK